MGMALSVNNLFKSIDNNRREKPFLKYLISETDFSISLLRSLSNDSSIIFSPLSISLALSLVYSGAKNNTKSQLGDVLLKGASDSDFIEYFSSLQSSFLNANRGVSVNLANRFFIRMGFEIKAEYLENIDKHFHAAAQSINFSDSDNSAKVVNQFVSTTTKGKIDKIVDSSAFTPNLVGIIVNALYLKADWMTEFNSSDTHSRTFYTTANDNGRKILFLNESGGRRQISEDRHLTLLSLQYKDESYSFNIFLPKKRFGLKNILSNINSNQILNLLSNRKYSLVNVHIPKMKLESEMSLKKVLLRLGIEDMFSEGIADFSNISDEGIFVSDVIHKAIVEVDEKGTVAAAATRCDLEFDCASIKTEKPIEFLADHPFLFTINKDEHIIFIGIHY